MDRVLLDIREAYHPAAPGALRIPLGVILVEPAALARDRAYDVVGQDPRQALFAARILREQGLDALPR